MRNFVLTSSSVTDGHPDKLCDRISDAIVDALLTLDPCCRVQAECAIATGIVFLALHSRTSARVDLPSIVRQIVSETGYADPEFNEQNLTVLTSEAQLPMMASTELSGTCSRLPADPVSATLFGYACRHSTEMLPLSCVLAHRLASRMRDVRRSGELPNLHPDGNVQVALRYHNRQPQCIEGITIFSALDADGPKSWDVSEEIRKLVVDPVVRNSEVAMAKGCMISINPVDTVNIGGPTRHAGLTGRKTDIDTYGGYSRHSGAALSGKDPSRIDRTGAYAARYAAKTIVASGLADECEVQISYTMGRPEPISLEIDTFGSAKLPEAKIRKALCETLDFNVNAIIDTFKLEEQPKICGGRFFTNLAVFGHFGRDDLRLPWEQTDKAALLARNV
jgi:S-adenosylmethionine synthetase